MIERLIWQALHSNQIAQSICTYYFSFEKLGGLADLKKLGQCRDMKKQGVKKQGLDFFYYY